MNNYYILNKIKSWLAFFSNICSQVIISVILTYLIPALNIFLLLVLKKSFSLDTLIGPEVVNILLATNGCFIVMALALNYNNKIRRRMIFVVLGIVFSVNLLLFLLSILEGQGFEMNLSINMYRGFLLTGFIFAFITFVIGKFDELSDTEIFANQSRKLEEVNIGKEKIKL